MKLSNCATQTITRVTAYIYQPTRLDLTGLGNHLQQVLALQSNSCRARWSNVEANQRESYTASGYPDGIRIEITWDIWWDPSKYTYDELQTLVKTMHSGLEEEIKHIDQLQRDTALAKALFKEA
jgi:hypothetical protein